MEPHHSATGALITSAETIAAITAQICSGVVSGWAPLPLQMNYPIGCLDTASLLHAANYCIIHHHHSSSAINGVVREHSFDWLLWIFHVCSTAHQHCYSEMLHIWPFYLLLEPN
jgi:hypothetical protein